MVMVLGKQQRSVALANEQLSGTVSKNLEDRVCCSIPLISSKPAEAPWCSTTSIFSFICIIVLQ
jgi:hypothetical protein